MANIKMKKPSKEEMKIALESFMVLEEQLKYVSGDSVEIGIEEGTESIRIPSAAYKLLIEVLKNMSEGKAISLMPLSTVLTTQEAAEILACSRPHLVKLLEKGEIPFVKVGRHRRLKLEDVLAYKNKLKKEQKQAIIELMHLDEETDLCKSI